MERGRGEFILKLISPPAVRFDLTPPDRPFQVNRLYPRGRRFRITQENVCAGNIFGSTAVPLFPQTSDLIRLRCEVHQKAHGTESRITTRAERNAGWDMTTCRKIVRQGNLFSRKLYEEAHSTGLLRRYLFLDPNFLGLPDIRVIHSIYARMLRAIHL